MHSIQRSLLGAISILSSAAFGQEALMPEKGYLTLKSGEVEIESASGDTRKVSRVTESQKQAAIELAPGESVKTDGQTQCSIAFPPFGVAQLEPNTKAKLATPGPDTKSSLELLAGKLYIDVNQENLKPTKQEFRLKTPTAILAVKGTQFFTESVEGVETSGVHTGAVQVFRELNERPIALGRGKAIEATNGEFALPRPLSKEELAMSTRYADFTTTYVAAEREKRSFRKDRGMDAELGPEIDGFPSLMMTMEEKTTHFTLNLTPIKGTPDIAYFKIRAKSVGYITICGWFTNDGKDVIGFSSVYRLIEMGHDSSEWMDLHLPLTINPNFGGGEIEKGEIRFTMVSEPGGSWIKVSPVFAGYTNKEQE